MRGGKEPDVVAPKGDVMSGWECLGDRGDNCLGKGAEPVVVVAPGKGSFCLVDG
jgi:hypothetical protein